MKREESDAFDKHKSTRGAQADTESAKDGLAKGEQDDNACKSQKRPTISRRRSRFEEIAVVSKVFPSTREELFTEDMWEDPNCRQILRAMFFTKEGVISADSEEFKELEEFAPKYLARRAAVTMTAAASSTSVISAAKGIANEGGEGWGSAGKGRNGPLGHRKGEEVGRNLPPVLANLPSKFHKRYTSNFTVLTPGQCQEQEAAGQAQKETRRGRGGEARVIPFDHRPLAPAASNSASSTISPGAASEAAMRDLRRLGVLDQEAARGMLRSPGPLLDFQRGLLHAFLEFRMRRSLARIVKIRRDRAALPIAAFETVIVDAVAKHPAVLVAGDTGCGKSTQVPQFLLKAGYGRVACTQPRRISAMGLCRRVAYETLNEHGSEVAYQVRFDTSRRRSSRILFLTEGLLLRQIARDPDLSAYSVVIVDEVHERHATGDFLLGLLRAVLGRRPLGSLKVVLMSATINPELFSRYFDGAPLIRVPGRMYPVEVRHIPTTGDDNLQEVVTRHGGEGQRKLRSRPPRQGGKERVVFDARPYVKLLESIDKATPRDERGDLLVFLSGMGDMLAVSEGLRDYVEGASPQHWIVLMLHSSLSVEEQDKVFDVAPTGMRKCVLSTNIAETSVTIDGIRFVADSGKAKEMSWDPRSGVRSLQEFWVSRASAEQRKGRAGRTGPGTCFRLYTPATFDRLPPFAEPEIRRCPLEGLVLQMKSLGMRDPRLFPYLSPPPPENLRSALASLALLGCTDLEGVVDTGVCAVTGRWGSGALGGSRSNSGSRGGGGIGPGPFPGGSSGGGVGVGVGEVNYIGPGSKTSLGGEGCVARWGAGTGEGHQRGMVRDNSSSTRRCGREGVCEVNVLQGDPRSSRSQGFEGKKATSAESVTCRHSVTEEEGGVLGAGGRVMSLEDIVATAPLTPLGRLLANLPVEPSVGKMLALGALFGVIEHVLTLAAVLSTQTPFDARASSAVGGANPVAEFASLDGDPFTVMNAYDEWVRVKAERKQSSRRWCRRKGVQEQRLYEITKLRRQFEDLLRDAGLLHLCSRAIAGGYENAVLRGRGGQRGRERRRKGISSNRLQSLKARGRKRKMLKVDDGVVGRKGEDVDEGEGKTRGEIGVSCQLGEGVDNKAKGSGEEDLKDLQGEVEEGTGTGLDLSSLEFYMAQDVDQLAECSGRKLTRRDVSVLKVILCQGLYPNFAVPDAANAGRTASEQQYVTRASAGLFMSPSSVLTCLDFGEVDRRVGGGRGTFDDGRSGMKAVETQQQGHGDGLLCYGHLMETQRPFVSQVTMLPALQTLLLFCGRVDTSEDASLLLFDHWLLVRMRGQRPALEGQKLLALACGLRARLGALLMGALQDAEKEGIGSGQQVGRGGREGHRVGDDKWQPYELPEEKGLEDLPPLLRMARWAFLERGSHVNGVEGLVRVGGVDWGQVAEDLSVELAEFMLQPIGYDMKSVTPAQIETLLLDPSRIKETCEVQRILEGIPSVLPNGLSGTNSTESSLTGSGKGPGGDDRDEALPELMHTLSEKIEEEVRGVEGLFGQRLTVLRRLKGGVEVTPFLRYGSVREPSTAGPAPHGLVAQGLKKWWRCPRCSVSKVVDLQAIHEHFKVCSAGVADEGNGVIVREKDGQGVVVVPGEERSKKRRMLGTSVKTLRHGSS